MAGETNMLREIHVLRSENVIAPKRNTSRLFLRLHYFTSSKTRTNRTGRAKRNMPFYGPYQVVYIARFTILQLSKVPLLEL